MKEFAVTQVRWASWQDMSLPLYRRWNERNRLPAHFWQRIWEYPFLASHVPKDARALDVGGTYPFVLFPNFPNAVSLDIRDLNRLDHPLHKGLWPEDGLVVASADDMPFEDDAFEYSFCISAIEEMPDPLAVLKEMLRVTRRKVLITTDISEKLGMPAGQLAELASFLGVEIPLLPPDALVSSDRRMRSFGMRRAPEYDHIRVIGLVLENTGPEERSCGIIVPHWESFPFLEACVRRIRRHADPSLAQHIYIVDDASKDGSFEKIEAAYSDDEDVTLVRVDRPNPTVADVGLLLDYGLEHVREKYVCMIDADLFPTNDDWLAFPIHLLEKHGCSSVGCDTGLANAYLLMGVCSGDWANSYGSLPGFTLFGNENFTCTNNFYRVMKTSLAKIVSDGIGFSRRSTKTPATVPGKVARRLERLSYRLRKGDYCPPHCDNGVAANHFIDVNRLGPKYSIPITSAVGFTPSEGVFGQNVCGLVFHFALSTRALSRLRREVGDAGADYAAYSRAILEDGLSDELLDELLAKCSPKRWFSDDLPESWYEEQQALFEREYGLYKRGLSG
ncbi:MAG: glycosyltransferase [Actinobacteria bacterium]|nr:MAG: glycosyltransferase [Actinomycetota bacterium]